MENIHAGHRNRLREKLEKGKDAILDHELLEIILFPLLPRKNTNELAHRLLAHFGNLTGVWEGSMEEFQKVSGVGENIAYHLCAIGEAFRRYAQSKPNDFQGRFESTRFVPFVKEQYANANCEVVDVYMIDSNGGVKAKHRFTDRIESSVEISPADIADLISKDAPSGLVLVHNHPAGEAVPSAADDKMTKCCQFVCNMNGVLLCDHFIYAPNGVYSYYLSGRMSEISRKYTINNAMKDKK